MSGMKSYENMLNHMNLYIIQKSLPWTTSSIVYVASECNSDNLGSMFDSRSDLWIIWLSRRFSLIWLVLSIIWAKLRFYHVCINLKYLVKNFTYVLYYLYCTAFESINVSWEYIQFFDISTQNFVNPTNNNES